MKTISVSVVLKDHVDPVFSVFNRVEDRVRRLFGHGPEQLSCSGTPSTFWEEPGDLPPGKGTKVVFLLKYCRSRTPGYTADAVSAWLSRKGMRPATLNELIALGSHELPEGRIIALGTSWQANGAWGHRVYFPIIRQWATGERDLGMEFFHVGSPWAMYSFIAAVKK